MQERPSGASLFRTYDWQFDMTGHPNRIAWLKAKAMALKNLQEMTSEEDAAITADAEADPDNPPADELILRRGRRGDRWST